MGTVHKVCHTPSEKEALDCNRGNTFYEDLKTVLATNSYIDKGFTLNNLKIRVTSSMKLSFFSGESPSHPGQGHVYLTDGGLDCCSNRSISFHYITPQEMYALEYLIYRIRTH